MHCTHRLILLKKKKIFSIFDKKKESPKHPNVSLSSNYTIFPLSNKKKMNKFAGYFFLVKKFVDRINKTKIIGIYMHLIS